MLVDVDLPRPSCAAQAGDVDLFDATVVHTNPPNEGRRVLFFQVTLNDEVPLKLRCVLNTMPL